MWQRALFSKYIFGQKTLKIDILTLFSKILKTDLCSNSIGLVFVIIVKLWGPF